MNHLFTRLLSALRGSVAWQQLATALQGNPRRELLAWTGTLPIGLVVTHTPSQVRACRGPNAGRWRYTWHFSTEVRALDRSLVVVQFAIVAWDGEKWILPPPASSYNCALLTQRDFQEWYHCPDGTVEPGRPALDPENWAGSSAYRSFKQKWLYIGVDAAGRRFRGEGIVELVAESGFAQKPYSG